MYAPTKEDLVSVAFKLNLDPLGPHGPDVKTRAKKIFQVTYTWVVEYDQDTNKIMQTTCYTDEKIFI